MMYIQKEKSEFKRLFSTIFPKMRVYFLYNYELFCVILKI